MGLSKFGRGMFNVCFLRNLICYAILPSVNEKNVQNDELLFKWLLKVVRMNTECISIQEVVTIKLTDAKSSTNNVSD